LARIPEDVIQRLREQADIVEIVSAYTPLKRAGRSHKGCCPFHDEKTPSFHVYPEDGGYHCFGCQEHGSVFDFLMKRGGLSFREALEEVSRQTGIALPEPKSTPEDAERQRRLEAMRAALDFAAHYFRKILSDLPAGEQARRYLADRGFTAQSLEEYGVGFSRDVFDGPHSLLEYGQAKGFSLDILERAGLVRVNETGRRFDFFRGRVMFPIRDRSGRVIGFGARALEDGGPKYINSSDTELFNKSRELYGQDLARGAARKAGRLLVCEGYTDVMHCRQAGFPETVAGLGTALTVENAGNLRRFGVPVYLLYDGDEAGRRAAERAADLLLVEEVEASVAILPSGQDPADLLTREGPTALEAILERAQSLLDYRIGCLASKHDLGTIDGGERAAREMIDIIVRMQKPIRREMALKLLAERLGVSESILRNLLAERQERADRAQRPAATAAAPGPAGAPGQGSARELGQDPAGPPDGEEIPDGEDSPFRGDSTSQAAEPRVEVPKRVRHAEIHFLEAALADPSSWDRISARYPAASFQDPDLRRIAGAVHTLRQGGESINRDALRNMLDESSETLRALQLLRPSEDVVAHAEMDLEQLLRRAQLDEARQSNSLEAVKRARSISNPGERTEADR